MIFNLLNRNFPYGRRHLKVKAKAPGFVDSDWSNTIEWNCQPVLSMDRENHKIHITNINDNVTGINIYINGTLTDTVATSGGVDIEWSYPVDLAVDAVITIRATGAGVNENESNSGKIQLILGATGFDSDESPLERTDDAVDYDYVMSNNIISSDFDEVYPYSEMKRSTDDNGDVWVKIPEIYWRFEHNSEGHIKSIACSQYPIPIGENQVAAHTAEFYFGAYGTSAGACSKSGVARQYNRSITNFRADATAKGLMQLDLMHMRIVDFLWCIEFATKNSDTVMWGLTSYNQNCGATDVLGDDVPTGQLAHQGRMRYRFIEDFIGNGFEWFDGVFGQYVTDDPTKFATNNGTVRTLPQYANSGYEIRRLFFDSANPFLATPAAVVNNSAYNKGYGDYCHWNASSAVGYRGRNGANAINGLFYWDVCSSTSYTNSSIGSRLIKTL